jgi:hypothetical protein
MAGESNYGGNGSVYWRTRHFEGGQPAHLKKRGNAKCEDQATPNDHTLDIGSPTEVRGRDPHGDATSFFTVSMKFDTTPAGSGAAAGSGAVAGGVVSQSDLKTAVRTARVQEVTSALEALISSAQTALDDIRRGEPDTTVEVRVPAIPRQAAPMAGWEVTVKWN